MRRLLLLPLFAMALQAQCVMCYLTAHAQNAARARLLDIGIVILGAPPFLILTGFVVYIHRRNGRDRDDQ